RCYRDWSSDVCSSDLSYTVRRLLTLAAMTAAFAPLKAQIVSTPSSSQPANTTPATATGHTKIRALAVVEFTGDKPASGSYRLVRSEERRVGKELGWRI